MEEIASFITLFLQIHNFVLVLSDLFFFHLSNNLLRDALCRLFSSSSLSSSVYGSLQQNRGLFAHDGHNISTYAVQAKTKTMRKKRLVGRENMRSDSSAWVSHNCTLENNVKSMV